MVCYWLHIRTSPGTTLAKHLSCNAIQSSGMPFRLASQKLQSDSSDLVEEVEVEVKISVQLPGGQLLRAALPAYVTSGPLNKMQLLQLKRWVTRCLEAASETYVEACRPSVNRPSLSSSTQPWPCLGGLAGASLGSGPGIAPTTSQLPSSVSVITASMD